MSTCSFKFQQLVKELEEFKTKFGHCDVPSKYSPNPVLGNWVKNQRFKFKKWKSAGTKVPPCHRMDYKALKDLGFSWNVQCHAKKCKQTERFEHLVERLEKFKDQHPAVWCTASFNGDASLLPKDFTDLTTLYEEIKEKKLGKARKELLMNLRVKFPTVLPIPRKEMILEGEQGNKNEEDSHFFEEKEREQTKKVRFQSPDKTRRKLPTVLPISRKDMISEGEQGNKHKEDSDFPEEKEKTKKVKFLSPDKTRRTTRRSSRKRKAQP